MFELPFLRTVAPEKKDYTFAVMYALFQFVLSVSILINRTEREKGDKEKWKKQAV